MDIFYQLYDRFLSVFPEPTQWFVSLVVVISLIAAFYVLIRFHWIFILIFIIFLPFTIPAFKEIFGGVYDAFLFIWSKTGISISVEKT